jgi:purine-cytosine permease-like protein
MARDDEVDEGTSFDPTFATAGPRRSTFTPPPGSPAYTAPTDIQSGGSDDEHDDDELAQALAADLGRIASGAISIPGLGATGPTPAAPNASGTPVVNTSDAETSEADSPAPSPAPAVPAAWLEAVMPDTRMNAEPAAARGDESSIGSDLSDAPPPASGAFAASDVPPPAPWSSLPAPDPADAVDLPGAPPRAPQRRSLPDSELLALADGGDAGERIEQLQEQLRLRESEAREFSTWEARMLALGTPEAFAAVRDARSRFSDVIGPPTTPGTDAIPVFDEQPVPAEPVREEPLREELLADEPVVAEQPTAESVIPEPVERPLPAWDVPPPSATWSPGPDLDEEPPAEPAPVAEVLEAPAIDEVIEASEGEPVVGGPAGDVADTDPAANVSVSVFAPPALVEPPPFGGPSLLPSEAASVPPLVVDSVPVFAAPDRDSELVTDAGSHAGEFDARDVGVIEDGIGEADVVGSPVEGAGLVEVDDLEADVVEPDVIEPVLVEPDVIEPVLVEPDVIEPVLVEPDVIEPDGGLTAVGGVAAAAAAAAAAASATAPEFSFDDLIAGLPETGDEEPARDEPSGDAAPIGGAESLFIEPLPVAAGEPVPVETGSVVLVEPAYEEETDDVVAETDRVAYVGGEPTGPVILPPSGPIATARVADDETVLQDDEPVAPRAFVVEAVGPEPTPLDRRVGSAARLFWLWFAANASIISLGLGATVFAIGMSLRQSIVAILVGVALSFIPLGLTTLAGKRSGQPTMIVSRASFGHRGNVLPAAVAVVTRVFWGAVMLWLAASAIAVVLVGAGLDGGLPESVILIASLAVLFAVAFVVAIFGYGLFARLQLVLSMLSAVLVMGFIVLTAGYIDVAAALTVADSSWLRAIGGAVLVFSVIGLVWAHSGSDLARYQRPESNGAGSMLWATFGAGLPAFLLVAYGALLAASNERIAEGFLTSPLDTLALMLPSWYPVPLIAATVLSLLSGVVITIYSGGFAVQALGVRVARPWAVLVVALLLGGVTLAVGFALPGGLTSVVRDAATTLAVPTAAWAGIITAETMIRNRRFESGSLVSRGGVYGDWRWGNLIGFVLISALGFGLTTAQVAWLSWQGYVLDFFAVPRDSDLASTDLGVLVALALGILLPIVVGIPAIRRQEETRL